MELPSTWLVFINLIMFLKVFVFRNILFVVKALISITIIIMNIIKSIDKHNNNHRENYQKSGNILNSMSCTSRGQFSNTHMYSYHNVLAFRYIHMQNIYFSVYLADNRWLYILSIIVFFLLFVYRVHSHFGKRFTRATFTIFAFITLLERENVFHAHILLDSIYIYSITLNQSAQAWRLSRIRACDLLNVVKSDFARVSHEPHTALFCSSTRTIADKWINKLPLPSSPDTAGPYVHLPASNSQKQQVPTVSL